MLAERAALGAALAALLLISGCGSTDSSEEASPSSIASATPVPGSLQDYIARADHECDDAHRQLDHRPPPRTLADVANYLSVAIDVQNALEQRLRALTPPPASAAGAASVLNDFQSLIDVATQARQQARAGDVVGADRTITGLQAKVEAASQRAHDFGFRSCGQVPGQGPTPST